MLRATHQNANLKFPRILINKELGATSHAHVLNLKLECVKNLLTFLISRFDPEKFPRDLQHAIRIE